MIGWGSYANVFLAQGKFVRSRSTAFASQEENTSVVDNTKVAIKIYDTTSKKHKNIATEVKILQMLDHPHIIKIKEVIEV